MRTELVQEVQIERYAVFAEMAWLVPRPELGIVCRRAREDGDRITESVLERALPAVSKVGYANLRRWCHALDLCDASGSLTALGHDVADTGQAPIPEQGIYDIWVARHALVGARLLHAERMESKRDDRAPFGEKARPPVAADAGQTLTSVLDGQRFALRAFPTNHGRAGVVAREVRAHCQVRWQLDWPRGVNRFHLEGVLEGRPIRHEPEPAPVDPWRLVAAWGRGPLRARGVWSEESRRLETAFAGLGEEDQESFTTDLDIEEAEVADVGRWRGVRLTEVPIGPATAADASSWAMARLDRRLRADDVLLTRADVRELFIGVTEDTPLAAFEPWLPDHETLLASCAREPDVYWRLAAPVDLAPQPPDRAMLGRMRVSRDLEGGSTPEEGDGLLRVPHPGGWSMRRLLRGLHGQAAPRRVLLVDRYVRGPKNLVSLRMLVAALAERGSPALDVWTGDEVNEVDVAEIEEVTGRPPRRYGEVFGRDRPPHDRYYVVVPDPGPPFGWQLSNSPLHGRARPGVEPSPSAPLRWDMTAARLSVEELPPQLRSWASGGGK